VRLSEQWQPKIVAELNGHEVKLVKVQGTSVAVPALFAAAGSAPKSQEGR
jgi:hypothetical protein